MLPIKISKIAIKAMINHTYPGKPKKLPWTFKKKYGYQRFSVTQGVFPD